MFLQLLLLTLRKQCLPSMVDHFEWVSKWLQVVGCFVSSRAWPGGHFLPPPGDGVPHGVVALLPYDLRQNPASGVDEPVADLSTNKHPCWMQVHQLTKIGLSTKKTMACSKVRQARECVIKRRAIWHLIFLQSWRQQVPPPPPSFQISACYSRNSRRLSFDPRILRWWITKQ